MKTAVCYKCGFRMRARGNAPSVCPLCGYDKSAADQQQARERHERAQARRREAEREAKRIWEEWGEK